MGRTKRRRKRRRSPALQPGDNSDVVALQKWMRLKRTNLRITSFHNTGRGIRSRSAVHVGDDLFTLPLRMLITPTTADCDAFAHLTDNTPSHHARLSIFLAYEAHLCAESHYRHYVKLLPSRYSTLFFCREKELEVMPRVMSIKIREQISSISSEYETVSSIYRSKPCTHCGNDLGDIFDYDMFTWAWFTVNTRSVYYKEGDRDTLALAPFLDMFNHSPDAETQLEIDHIRDLYVIRSLKEYRKHEEIFIKYGNHSNWRLIFDYGFLVEGNPHDCVEFNFDEVITSAKMCGRQYGELDREKYKFIKRNKLDVNLTKSKDEFSWSMTALLYVLVARDTNQSLMTAKCYSGEFDADEETQIRTISNVLVRNKRDSLLGHIQRMDSLGEDTSDGFSLLKKLLYIYIDILK